MRLLLVEDEPELRSRLTQRLTAEGYIVDTAADGETGLYLGAEYPIDAAVIDIGLPLIDGIELIRRWRRDGRSFPILILTARGKWEEKVAGLEAGGDDYLVKPFYFEELQARLRALLRRSAGWANSVLNCGPIELDISSKSVTVNGSAVELTAYEYRVLEYLMTHAGEVLSKGAITEHIYAEDAERDSNVLEVLVGRLRRKLDPDKRIEPIATVRGQGYVFRLPRSISCGH
jgi:two-component system response regulator PhoP